MIAFEFDHPIVGALYFTSALVLTMCCFQPVLVIISFSCALVCTAVQLGLRNVARMLSWQLPLALVIALVNPFFSAAGSTELFKIGVRAFYLESLAYGLCLGTMLAASVSWFSLAGNLLDTERVLAICSPIAPRLGLALAMVCRQVPSVVGCGRAADELYRTVAGGASASAASLMRAADVAATQALEGSIITARSMASRGYGAFGKRAAYRRYTFGVADACKVLAIALGFCLCAFLGWAAVSQYRFYPTMSRLRLWWGYVPYALYLLVPALAQAVSEVRLRG